MAVTDAHDVEPTDGHEESDTLVSAFRTAPDRVIFTESGNSEGWISTDHTVEPWQ
ncbi:MAG: hypothetical protein IH933_06470 [Euryarchaeota archaeon]|nr:hypothetical protein [Euryarchaeota archaeon]